MKIELKNQVSEGKTRTVIERLKKQAAMVSDKDLLNEVIQTAARYEDFERAKRLNHISHEDANRTLAQINYTLIEIIDRLPDNAPPQYIGVKSILVWQKHKGLFITGLIGLLALFLWQYWGTKAQTFSQTIVVVDKDGGLILDNQGKVLLHSPFGLAKII